MSACAQQEAVNADNALDEERRQQGVDRMEKAAELLGKLREVELVAKTALEETTAKLAVSAAQCMVVCHSVCGA